jgi:hypothetical protein
MKPLSLLLFFLLNCSWLTLAAENRTIQTKVAILAMHEPRDISFYQDLRRQCYEAWSLRAVRALDRWTGLRIDGDDWTFRTVALLVLFGITIGLFVGFLKRPWRGWAYGTSFSCGLLLIFWIWMYSGVARLNQIDIKGAHHVQNILDVTSAWGLETEVFSEWGPFVERWKDHNQQPFFAVCWMGIPLGADEMKMEQWIGRHQEVPLLQVCLGAHLPKRFQTAVFKNKAKMDWTPSSSVSVCDPKSAYGRAVHWSDIDSRENAVSIVPYGKNHILYGRVDVEAQATERWLKAGLEQLNIPWVSMSREGLAALRCDDPGSAQSLHLESWRFPPLGAIQWAEVADVLGQHEAKMSIGVVPNWLDDGDSQQGELSIAGKVIEKRQAGARYLSRDVSYLEHQSKTTYRPGSQMLAFAKHQSLEPELHGSTHISPRVNDWLKAKDRKENADWYREFLATEQRPFTQRPEDVQREILHAGLSAFEKTFQHLPTTLIPPGHALSWNTAEICFQEGLEALCDKHLVIQRQGQLRRSRLLFSAELSHRHGKGPHPHVLICHDRDLHRHGAPWLHQQLNRWKEAGLKRFISLREMITMIKSTPTLTVEQNRIVLALPPLEYKLNSRLKGDEFIDLDWHGPLPGSKTPLANGWSWIGPRKLRLAISTQNQPLSLPYPGDS